MKNLNSLRDSSTEQVCLHPSSTWKQRSKIWKINYEWEELKTFMIDSSKPCILCCKRATRQTWGRPPVLPSCVCSLHKLNGGRRRRRRNYSKGGTEVGEEEEEEEIQCLFDLDLPNRDNPCANERESESERKKGRGREKKRETGKSLKLRENAIFPRTISFFSFWRLSKLNFSLSLSFFLFPKQLLFVYLCVCVSSLLFSPCRKTK